MERTLAKVAISPLGRSSLERAALTLDSALTPSIASNFYGSSYFDRTDSGAARKASGYRDYTRTSSHADVLALLLASHIPLSSSLDVGCARGFLVEALLEIGVDAYGCDLSEFAINTASRGARGRLRWADMGQGIPWPDKSFSLVSAFEILEHLPPESVPGAIDELARVSRDFVVASIPSFGPRPGLPSGWFEGKIRPSLVAEYKAKGSGFTGPVDVADLERDDQGNPIEGHLTIASFEWWRAQFRRAGLTHRADLEVAFYQHSKTFNLDGFFDLYVFSQGPRDAKVDEALVARAQRALKPMVSRRQHGTG